VNVEQSDAEALFTSVRAFLWEAKTGMKETYSTHPDNDNKKSPLHNFKQAWGISDAEVGTGGVKGSIPADYAQACFEYEKQQQKASSSITVDGIQLQMDENGYVTIMQDRQFILLNAQQAPRVIAALNSLVPAADIPPTDVNTQNVVPGGAGQMSQNERTFLAMKALKVRRGY
jgi:hypothetical protein